MVRLVEVVRVRELGGRTSGELARRRVERVRSIASSGDGGARRERADDVNGCVTMVRRRAKAAEDKMRRETLVTIPLGNRRRNKASEDVVRNLVTFEP